MNRALPDRLDEAAATLVTVARAMRRAVPDRRPAALGVGGTLQARWAAAVAARADETSAAADRVLDASAAVRTANREYAATDDLVSHRLGHRLDDGLGHHLDRRLDGGVGPGLDGGLGHRLDGGVGPGLDGGPGHRFDDGLGHRLDHRLDDGPRHRLDDRLDRGLDRRLGRSA